MSESAPGAAGAGGNTNSGCPVLAASLAREGKASLASNPVCPIPTALFAVGLERE
jgi:hypothetical protein